MARQRQACLEAGMVDHIAKPVDSIKLASALLKWIAPSAMAPQRALKNDERTRLAPLLAEFEQLLASNKFSAKRVSERIEELLAGTPLAEPFQPVGNAARKLNFKEAQSALKAFHQRYVTHR